MGRQERTAIIPTSSDSIPFPKGTRVERRGDASCIYDPTGRKRWVMRQYIDNEKQLRLFLALEAETNGGTWHQLMGLYQARDANTGDEKSTGITVDVIDGDTYSGNKTPNRNIQYASTRKGIYYEGWGGGYYGRREAIERDLEEFHAVATTPDQLPKQIDVYGTVERLAETFWAGKFEPPQFVLPTEITHCFGVLPTISTLLKRIGRRNSREIQTTN